MESREEEVKNPILVCDDNDDEDDNNEEGGIKSFLEINCAHPKWHMKFGAELYQQNNCFEDSKNRKIKVTKTGYFRS